MSNSDLSKRIKDLRLLHGLTLEEVANQVGVGKSTVRKWETGMIANMRRDKITALAKALHTTPTYLMGWTDDSSQPAKIKIVKPLPFDLTEHERKVFIAYHEQPHTQPFVDKLLGIEEDSEILLAARGGNIALDKKSAAALAKSANEAPNSSQNKNMF